MDHLDQPSTNGVPTPKIVIQRFGSTMDHLDHEVAKNRLRLTKVDIWLKNVHLAYDVPSMRKLRLTKVDIWLKNVHLAYDVPSTPRSPLALPRFPSCLLAPLLLNADPRIRALPYRAYRRWNVRVRLRDAAPAQRRAHSFPSSAWMGQGSTLHRAPASGAS